MSPARSLLRTLSLLCVTATVVSCSADLEVNDTPKACKSHIQDYSSPAAGVLTFTGSFYSDESILVRNSSGSLLASGTPNGNVGTLTLTGLPSGTQSFTVIVSCDAGQEQLDHGDYTIK